MLEKVFNNPKWTLQSGLIDFQGRKVSPLFLKEERDRIANEITSNLRPNKDKKIVQEMDDLINQAQTNVRSFNYLQPYADGFRNYYNEDSYMSPTQMLVDKANLLGLNVPEMTVLVGGMRALGISENNHGVFTETPGKLTNDFFVTLLDMGVEWKPTGSNFYEASDRATGKVVRSGTRVDLVFGSNSQLRALAEVYATSQSHNKFVADFVAAWTKVMNADRFDVA